MLTDRERYLLLNLIPDVGSLRLKRLLDHFGCPERVWGATVQDLQQVQGIGSPLARRIATGCRDERLLGEELLLAQRHGVRILTREDADYPKALRDIPDPPVVLYVRGVLAVEDAAVALVGSRRASLYGLEVAERLAYELAARGVTIVSGLARGIDGAAHRGALKAGGRTVAVLGNGLSDVYPPEHAALAEQIASRGAIVSEYPMRMAPLAQNFPRRNRLISGLSLGVVLVEAAQRSGALVTCDCALEQGREVFAIPGRINSVTSQGTHQLLRDGAKLVTCAEDILEELRLAPRPVPRGARPGSAGQEDVGRPLTDEEQCLLAQLSPGEPLDFDTVAVKAGLPPAACAATLLALELKRRVKQLPGKRVVKI